MHIKIRAMAMVPILILGGMFIWTGSAAAQDVKAFVGDWSGAISGDGQELEIVCHFKLDENGALVGTIDAPGQGAVDLAIADIVVEGKKISFGVDDRVNGPSIASSTSNLPSPSRRCHLIPNGQVRTASVVSSCGPRQHGRKPSC